MLNADQVSVILLGSGDSEMSKNRSLSTKGYRMGITEPLASQKCSLLLDSVTPKKSFFLIFSYSHVHCYAICNSERLATPTNKQQLRNV